MDLYFHRLTKLRELSARCRTTEFERPRDEMGQFSDTSDTTPEKMRQAYVKPLRERLKRLRPRRFQAVSESVDFSAGKLVQKALKNPVALKAMQRKRDRAMRVWNNASSNDAQRYKAGLTLGKDVSKFRK